MEDKDLKETMFEIFIKKMNVAEQSIQSQEAYSKRNIEKEPAQI